MERKAQDARKPTADAGKAPAARPLLTLPTVVTHRAPKKKREDVRKLCGAASRARPKGELWLEEP